MEDITHEDNANKQIKIPAMSLTFMKITFNNSMFTGLTPAKVCLANSLSRNQENLSPEQVQKVVPMT